MNTEIQMMIRRSSGWANNYCGTRYFCVLLLKAGGFWQKLSSYLAPVGRAGALPLQELAGAAKRATWENILRIFWGQPGRIFHVMKVIWYLLISLNVICVIQKDAIQFIWHFLTWHMLYDMMISLPPADKFNPGHKCRLGNRAASQPLLGGTAPENVQMSLKTTTGYMTWHDMTWWS